MKIISLKSENVKRIKAVEIKPDGQSLVVIGGKNGNGKSSVLDSILYALGGANKSPSVPIRQGEDHASIELEIGDLIIRRTYNSQGNTYLKVENKEGAQFRSPQAMLDKLVGTLSFDPLEFSRMEPKKQVGTLKGLVGIDFTDLDLQRKGFFDERSMINRKIKEVEAVLVNTPHHSDAPDQEVSVGDLIEEQEAMEAVIAENNDQRRSLESKREIVAKKREVLNAHDHDICDLEKRLNRLREMRDGVREEIEKLVGEGKTMAEKVNALEDPDLTSVREQIKNAGAINSKVRDNQTHKSRLEELNQAKSELDNLNSAIQEIDQQKQSQLVSAKFPIPGMSFDENGVLLNNLPFEQASSAEQLKASVAMGLAINPKLRVLLIRDGSLLDEDSLKTVAEMAAGADAQVWLERVSEGEEVSLIIEDGMVKGAQEVQEVANG